MFRAFPYERRNPDGSLWQCFTVRHTLSGYTIPWGLYTEYYDDGKKSIEGFIYGSPLRRASSNRRFKYWLPNGQPVSQREWFEINLGTDVADHADPAWEH